MEDDEWDVIFSYTRQQAIEDGVLIEVEQKILQETGFKLHTVFTGTLYSVIIENEDPDVELVNKIKLLKEIHEGIMIEKPNSNMIRFQKKVGNFNYDIIAHVGPDDYGKPCFTIGFPEDL
jgi:hypothetical protein